MVLNSEFLDGIGNCGLIVVHCPNDPDSGNPGQYCAIGETMETMVHNLQLTLDFR